MSSREGKDCPHNLKATESRKTTVTRANSTHIILNLLLVEKSNSTIKSLGRVQKLSNFLTLSL